MHGDKMTSHVTDRSPSATIVPAAHGGGGFTVLVLVLETPHGEISDVTVMEVLHGGRSSNGELPYP